jgi:hypothetical protein
LIPTRALFSDEHTISSQSLDDETGPDSNVTREQVTVAIVAARHFVAAVTDLLSPISQERLSTTPRALDIVALAAPSSCRNDWRLT